MATSRMISPTRMFRRYRCFICAAICLLIVQLCIGYYQFFVTYQTENNDFVVNNNVRVLSSFTGPGFSRRFFANISTPHEGVQSYPLHKRFILHDARATVKCEITSDEALSAISRAKTQKCKEEITTLACLSQARQLYDATLPRYCPLKNTNDAGIYRGCYKDDHGSRDLDGGQYVFVNNTPQQCINACFKVAKRYAGMQYAKECWCGVTYGRYNRLPEAQCDQSMCPGDRNTTCGGYLANRVFSTGIESRVLHQVSMTNKSTRHIKEPVRILFLLTVNGRALRQIHRLLRAIYHSSHYYLIHVDVRQDYLFRELSKLESVYTNIRMVTTRLATIWGGASLLSIHLTCMQTALQMTDWMWDYVLNLSESDYPLKDNNDLVTFLTTYKGYNFVKSHGANTAKFLKKQGLEKTFFQCENRMWRLGERSLPAGVVYDGGSDWLCLHRDFVQYVIETDDKLSFFHSVLQNSAFCHTVVNNNLHLTNWRRKQGCKCQHKHVVDWCGCSPNDLMPDDLPKLLKTKHEATFFARKFEAIVNQEIINTIEGIVYNITRPDLTNQASYWQSDYHHLDTTRPSDAHISFYKSLMRLGVRHTQCNLRQPVLHEVTLYSVHSILRGVLVRFGLEGGGEMEVEVRTVNKYTYMGEVGRSRLITLQVGTDFDPKELILRNYAGVLGPNSTLTLLHSWTSGPDVTFTAVWIDPTAVIAASYDIDVPQGTHTDKHDPHLHTPLRPGVWTIKVLINWAVIAELSFLVVPYTQISGHVITADEVLANHNGPTGLYGPRNFSDFMSVMSLYEKREVLVERARVNGRKVGVWLEEWCDELVGGFWEVKEVCGVGPVGSVKGCQVDRCEGTTWSSLSPDPKSHLRPVDPYTGLIR